MNVLKESGDHYAFFCPGCKTWHSVGKGWTFNKDFEYPTFSPSILVRSGCKAPHFNKDKDSCWCTYNAERESAGENPSIFNCQLCHSYITNGEICFLSDSTHELSGRTVRLPSIEDA